MREFGVETGRVSVVDESRDERERPTAADKSVTDRADRSSERDELLAKVRRLELELERYRTHAERTSKLFLAATKYAEWVRENARHDAELALRKTSARIERLEVTAGKLEWTEAELVRRQDELERLDTLIEETRARLSAFLTAGLEALSTKVESGHEDGPTPPLTDLQDTLHRQLASTSAPTSGSVAEHEEQDH